MYTLSLLAVGSDDVAWSKPRSKKISVSIVSLTEGAEVFVNGALVGTVPLNEPLMLPPGEHVVKVTKRGYVDYYEVHRVKSHRGEVVIEADLLPFSGVVIIQTTPAGAQVVVDGVLLGETPFEGEVEGGQRRFEVNKPGFQSYERTAVMSAGDTYFLNLNLEPTPPEAFYKSWWFWGAASIVAVGTGLGLAFALADDAPIPSLPAPDRTLTIGLGF